MATVIERPSERVIDRREYVDRGDSGAGWAVALIILVALLVAGFVWARYYRVPAAAPANPGASINVSLPAMPSAQSGSNADNAPGNSTGAGPSQAPAQ